MKKINNTYIIVASIILMFSLKSTAQIVKAEIKAGKTKEDILKATTIPGAPEWQGDGIVRSLTAAYTELTTG